MIRFPPLVVDRIALVIEPLQPYFDWLDSQGGVPYTPSPDDEGEVVFLLPTAETPGEAQAYVEEYFDVFFTQLLEHQNSDFTTWPQHRTIDQFRAWFRTRIHSIVVDVGPDPLIHG